jgi:aryl-phospho-beta-D-glucosidase BglC (GH1 family)
MVKVSDGKLLTVSDAFDIEVKETVVVIDNNESDNDNDGTDNNDTDDTSTDDNSNDNNTTPIISTLPNFINSAGIEEGIDPWISFGGGSALQLSTAEAHTGTQSIFVAGRTAFYQGPASDIRSLMVDGKMVDGERYMASVWVRHSESSAKTLSLMIKQVDSDGTHYNKVENEVVTPNVWTKVTGFYLLNNSDSISDLMLYVTSSSDESVFDFYADDFYLSELEDYTPPTSSTASDFIRANGKGLAVGASNQAITLKGINVTVPSDADDTAESVWDVKSISAKDFNNIKALGFNSIRLHMNYISFEEDNAVGIYKKDGWHWLDRAISLAKDAGLYVMLDMHTPQGGYQSDKDEGFSAFWDGSGAVPNTSNQNRLIALWKAIASRYQHEPIILGYDFINEPRSNDSEEWFSYVEQIIAEVRAVDKNHMFVVEVPFIDNFTVRLVDDNNVMYDSHYYEPWGYTTQYSVGYRKGGKRWGAYTPTNPIYLDWSFDIVDASHAEAVPFDKTFLQDGLDSDSNFLKFARDNSVPVDVGEYGIVHEAFSQSIGAMDFLRDFHAVLDKDSVYDAPISRFYFSYQGGTFGIYTNWTGFATSENEVNNDVKKLFSEDTNSTDNVIDENEDKTFKVNSGGEVAYFSNHDLDTPNNQITHAIVVIHGTNRNALEYYQTIEDVAKSEGKLESTIIIAPHFKEASDTSFANELQWSDAGGWKSGSKSVRKDSLTRISSFAVLDEMVEELANNALFANLQEIIITGHSAGGQFTQRYAVTTEVDKDKDESFKYIVANAGTYLYINTLRPITGVFTEPSSEQIDDCPKYNNYKYGLNKPYSYLSSLTEETLRTQYANRQVIYLLGENDTVADSHLNQGCSATLQGANRYERGINYGAYMNHLNGLDTDGFTTLHKHRVQKVIGVGHSKNDMYQSIEGSAELFTK